MDFKAGLATVLIISVVPLGGASAARMDAYHSEVETLRETNEALRETNEALRETVTETKAENEWLKQRIQTLEEDEQ